jgi:hypothetical protein
MVGMLGLAVVGSWAQDDDLKEGKETPRYPNYTYEDELPHTTRTVPGASAGVFFERHRFGEGFLGRWRPNYLNYGWQDFENYRLNTTLHLRNYDAFGNFIANGYDMFALEEYRTRAPDNGSLLQKGRFYQDWLRNLVIADDVYGGWSTRLTMGDLIHTTFTPLTLDMVGFNGVRFDALSATDKAFTLLISRVSDPIRRGVSIPRTGVFLPAEEGVYLLGGHWETDVGQNLCLGATYLNLYRYDSLRGLKSNSRKGLALRNAVPQQIIVRFEDDSPEDQRAGAQVFDIVARVTLAPAPEDRVGKSTTTEVRPSSVETSPGVMASGRHLEASGYYRDTEGIEQPNYIDYLFDLSADAIGVEFAALAGNDYKISMRQNHFFVTDPLRGGGEKRSTDFFIIRRADGNVTDLSNKALIRFDYGLAAGMEVMGLNGKLTIPGLDVRGEVARSDNHYQYPTLLGQRSQFGDLAGYVTVAKEGPRFSLGAEAFSIGPRYTSYNPHPSGLRDPQSPLAEVFYFNDPRQSPYRNASVSTSNPFYMLVDDNDNMLTDETPDNWIVLGNPTETVSGTTGIFPFFDLNQDGHQDTNLNYNEFPDYNEPFLMYSADPVAFYFGDDFNNNGMTDAWEDDNLPNYPYYKNEQGLHLVGGVKPVQGLRLNLGRYYAQQIAASGRNQALYGRCDFERSSPGKWRVGWQHEAKDVRDDIANDYYFYSLREGIRNQSDQVFYNAGFYADRLEYRDSFANRGLLRVDYQPVQGWNLEGKFRYDLNHQRQHRFGNTGSSQPADDSDFYGGVVRTEYTYRRSALTVTPRYKVLYQFRDRRSQEEPIEKNLQAFPILRADYRLTDHSQVRLGVQGLPLPFLVDRRRDFVDRANDSEWTSWTLMWFNESEYESYRIGTEAGVMRQQTDFDEPGKQDVKFTRFFIRMISGVGSVVR